MKKTFLALLALLCTPFALRADTLYVTPAGAGAKDGSSWANAYAGIQAAVDAADAAYAADGTLVDCIIEDCIGYDGGGTFYSDTIRCIIRRCTASSWGGGGVEEGTHRDTLIHDCSTYVAIVYRATLYNCTVADTTAESDYYGVCYNSSIYNCVFWGNYVKGAWAEQNDEVDPKFVGEGDYRPRVGSPAIDDGDATYATEQYVGATDLAGDTDPARFYRLEAEEKE